MTRNLGIAVALATALILGQAGAASALMVGFTGPGGYGFDNAGGAVAPQWRIDAPEDWLDAGSRELDPGGDFALLVDMTQTALSLPDENYRVEVEWVIENATGAAVESAVIFMANLARPPAFPIFPNYPDDSVTIDDGAGSPFTVIEYTSASGTAYSFVGFVIEDFEPGPAGAVTRRFHYTVDRPESDLIGNMTPSIGLGAAVEITSVPEPTIALLLASSLAALARSRSRA